VCVCVDIDKYRYTRTHTQYAYTHTHAHARLTPPSFSRNHSPSTEKMHRPWSQQARQITPRRGTVAHRGNQKLLCSHSHGEYVAFDSQGYEERTHTHAHQLLWPLQEIRLLQSFYARVNHLFLAPPHLHCPLWCKTIARLLGSIRPPLQPLVCMPYTIQ